MSEQQSATGGAVPAEGTQPASCPFDPSRDDRKSAGLAARHANVESDRSRVGAFGFARELLRSTKFKRDANAAAEFDVGNPEHMPVFYLEGDVHRARRAAIVKFFLPKAIHSRYLATMEGTTDRLLKQLQATGRAQLDVISFELAAAVAAEIVGLGDSNTHQLSRRLLKHLDGVLSGESGLRKLRAKAQMAIYGAQFFLLDVMPAVRARRKQPREDVISQTIEKGYSNKAILIECLTYATAGMVTTREFIVMAAWHMFDRPALRAQFIAADEDGQLAILQEILRLEPIAAMIYLRTDEDVDTTARGKVSAKSKFAIDLRALHGDEALVGPCPYALDPDRAKKLKQNGTYFSFGDGPHRCPGWQVALTESRVFLDRLMRVPGIRLERAPDMGWNEMLTGYELRNAVVVCDKVA
jgi:cytochrome P450